MKLSRRDFFRPWQLPRRPPRERLPPPFLRPPGALPEAEFRVACTRCGDCAVACPEQAIVSLGLAYGVAEGGPAITPRATACALCEDLPCVRACGDGALILTVATAARMGLAVLDPQLCLAAAGQSCDDCLRACPVGELAIRAVAGVPMVDAAACTGCGKCEFSCPTQPAAITVRPPFDVWAPIHEDRENEHF